MVGGSTWEGYEDVRGRDAPNWSGQICRTVSGCTSGDPRERVRFYGYSKARKQKVAESSPGGIGILVEHAPGKSAVLASCWRQDVLVLHEERKGLWR